MFRRIGAVVVSLLLMWFGHDLVSRDETECAALSVRRRAYSCLSQEDLDRDSRRGTVSPDVVGSVILGAGALVLVEAGWLTYRDQARRRSTPTPPPTPTASRDERRDAAPPP